MTENLHKFWLYYTKNAKNERAGPFSQGAPLTGANVCLL